MFLLLFSLLLLLNLLSPLSLTLSCARSLPLSFPFLEKQHRINIYCRRSGRQLEKWVPDHDVADIGSLEAAAAAKGARGASSSSSSSATGGWNQFAANEAKFGVKTNYSEDVYTTKIDAGRAGISAAEADRIAREIERGVGGTLMTANAHLAEERGGELADDVDEEALYSSVGRAPAAAAPAPRPAAWGSAGSGVAAVAGKTAVNARREHAKVRAQLEGGAGSGSEPASPLVGDAAAVAALDLYPGTAKFDDETRRAFAEH